jgi:hypothetical protein
MKEQTIEHTVVLGDLTEISIGSEGGLWYRSPSASCSSHPIPLSALQNSDVLQTLWHTTGRTLIPILVPHFKTWLSYVMSDGRSDSMSSLCTVIKVCSHKYEKRPRSDCTSIIVI